MTTARRLLSICAINALILGGVHAPAYSEKVKFCASEGEVCWLKKRSVVRYGTPENYVERTVHGRILCGSDLFGDPALHQPKVCWIVED